MSKKVCKQEVEKSLAGVNIIFSEAIDNFNAFETITKILKKRAVEVPTALLMLRKVHFEVYIIEIAKLLLNSSDNEFCINRVFNLFTNYFGMPVPEINSFRKEISENKEIINNIKKLRNNVFAHSDKDFLNFSGSGKYEHILEINDIILRSVKFLNGFGHFEFNRYSDSLPSNIIDFYGLIDVKILDEKLPNSITTTYF